MSNNSTVILLKDQKPDSLFLSQLYDPDLDGAYVDGSAKLIPKPGSLVIDKENGGHLYYVSSLDEKFKATLVPCRLLETEDGSESIKVLSYGNDKFYLFFDDRVKPTKLNIDSKLIVFGQSLQEYRIVRKTSSGEKEIVSAYIDTNEAYRGERIPLADISENSGAKQLTNCHTFSKSLQDGDTVEAEIYDSTGVLCLIVQLYTKRASILNDLSSTNSLIIGFDATSNQMLGSDFYIYQRQDPSHLAITPTLTYADLTTEQLVINNKDCFLYGLENFTPTFPGQKQKIMIKKYLNYRQQSELSTQIGDKRFVVCEKMITVISNTTVDGIKVSVIPIYDLTEDIYYLKYVAYTDKKDKVIDVTSYVQTVDKFDGLNVVGPQKHTFNLDLGKIFNSDVYVPYTQTCYISLKPYKEYQRYTLSDYADLNPVYGVESSLSRRPVIMYDASIEQYFIPTSKFANKEAFLEAFYYNANPPYDTNESIDPIKPTHFTIRALDNLSTIITAPIEIDQYAQAWNISRTGDPSMLVGYNVLVEFLVVTTSNTQILYGVPVDVHLSESKYTRYNTEQNNIG